VCVIGASGLYDRARPSYPQEAFNKILSVVPPSTSSEGSTIVELGAGSGIFTRGFLETILSSSEEKNKNKVGELEFIAVEPSRGMREGWEKKHEETFTRIGRLKESGIKVEIRDGLFDKIPVEDAKADLVRVFSAFQGFLIQD